jgi:hypothetical protein
VVDLLERLLATALETPFGLERGDGMKNRRSQSSASCRAVATILFILPLTLLSARSVVAQPGERRTQEQIKADLNNRLAEADGNLSRFPESGSAYLARALIYGEFFYTITDEEEKASYGERALTDFNKAVELSPGDWTALTERARFRASFDLLSGFDAIVADYLEVIRGAEKVRNDNARFPGALQEITERIAEYYFALSNIYLSRAESLSRRPRFRAKLPLQPEPSNPWDDFDAATAYAQKAVIKPSDLMRVIRTRMAKGDAAYTAREYVIALEAYQSDERYLGKDYYLLCENEINRQRCSSDQRALALMFSIRRGRAYLELRQPEKALAELEVYFAKAYHLECRDIFLLRAQANRQLGNEVMVLADEEKANKSGSAKCPFDIQ